MTAWFYDDSDERIEFETEQNCCDSCIDDKNEGSDTCLSACCCTHSREADERGLRK
jgi:hypothetical protein